MSSRAASRVVIGVGLAVVFGIGVSFIVEQGTHNQAAHNAPAAAAPSNQTAVNPPATDAAASSRNAVTAPQVPPAVASPEPAASNPPVAMNHAVPNGANSARGTDAIESGALRNDTSVPKPRHGSLHAQSTASVNSETRPAPAVEGKSATENSSDGNEGADVDQQMTAQVRTSIANLAPGSNVDVKAIGGVVALAGSVPSQDLLEQARQAAQQVPGVKQVDTSALLVRNQ